jgi:hypothetical protein
MARNVCHGKFVMLVRQGITGMENTLWTLKESVGFDKFKRVGLREQCLVAISVSNQLDVTLLSFLFCQLYIFRAFFAHLQE